MGAHLQRAFVLYEQSRHDLAEKELRQELASDPESPDAHALLALCLAQRKQYREATEIARKAVALDPDLAYPHFALGTVLQERNQFAEAETCFRFAIEREPECADYYAALSGVQFERRKWSEALASAEEGLQFDPEHIACNNLRAMALVKLGRRAEAGATIDATLARNPDMAVTHANMGWVHLEQGKPRAAMEAFREALRLDPTLEYARAGIVEAMKARNLIYRVFLLYFLWMAKLSGVAQWGIILGGYLGYRFLRTLANQRPELAPLVWPLLLAYMLFALLTWIAEPLFNLLLRLDRFGRYALSREQVVASNWVGACLLGALVALLGFFVTWDFIALLAAGGLLLLVMPVAAVFHCQPGWPRAAMAVYTAALAAVGVAALVLLATDQPYAEGLSMLFLLGAFISGFVGNALVMAVPRK